MLRITRGPSNHRQVTLNLEGRLISDWVALLERECIQALDGGDRVQLDFSEVSRIDSKGADAVRQLASRGVRIVNCPDVIKDVLDDGQD